MQLVQKRAPRKQGRPRHPARRATDFPTDSTAIRAKNRPGDATILARTGKSWRQWFLLLGSSGVDREQLQQVIAGNTSAPPSWQDIVLIAYELDCGMRGQYVRPQGYEISTARTVGASAPKLFRYWEDEELRRGWLPGKQITVHEAVPGTSMRLTWEDGKSSLGVDFHSTDANKTRITVHHQGLAQEQVREMKGFWTKTLKKFKAAVEASA